MPRRLKIRLSNLHCYECSQNFPCLDSFQNHRHHQDQTSHFNSNSDCDSEPESEIKSELHSQPEPHNLLPSEFIQVQLSTMETDEEGENQQDSDDSYSPVGYGPKSKYICQLELMFKIIMLFLIIIQK